GRQPGGAGPDDPYTFSRPPGRGFGDHPSLLERMVDDRLLDALDGHRFGDQSQHAGSLAGSRTDTPGEFLEIVGFMQPVKSLFPLAAIDQIVPFRDEVVDRAPHRFTPDLCSALAERYSAIHAAGTLSPEFLLR